MADAETVSAAIAAICRDLAEHEEYFRSLDARLGDGDLGVTVRMGAEAVASVLDQEEVTSIGEVLAVAGREFSRANPSTLAGLVGAAMKSVSREIGTASHLEPTDWIPLLGQAADTVAQRGGAHEGDKTILDGLLGSLAAMRESPSAASSIEVAERARGGAERASQMVQGLESRVGRASWQGARSVGCPDPGIEVWVAATRALERFASATVPT